MGGCQNSGETKSLKNSGFLQATSKTLKNDRGTPENDTRNPENDTLFKKYWKLSIFELDSIQKLLYKNHPNTNFLQEGDIWNLKDHHTLGYPEAGSTQKLR